MVKANEAVSFEAREAETLAIVGESGCGKSTLARVLLGLETATEGTITLGNEEIGGQAIERRATRTVASIQMVFQNPFDTLNPSHSIGGQIVRVLEKFRVGRNQPEREARMLELLDLVRLPRAFAAPDAAPALRRPEAAHRHRPRLRRRARRSSSPTSRSPRSTSRCRPPSPSC